jgi:hypothetical protein
MDDAIVALKLIVYLRSILFLPCRPRKVFISIGRIVQESGRSLESL